MKINMVPQIFVELSNIKFNQNRVTRSRVDSCVRWKMVTLYVTAAAHEVITRVTAQI
jgi:hypothetical protein